MHQQFATLPVDFLLYTAASVTDYETIGFDGEQVNLLELPNIDRTALYGWTI